MAPQTKVKEYVPYWERDLEDPGTLSGESTSASWRSKLGIHATDTGGTSVGGSLKTDRLNAILYRLARSANVVRNSDEGQDRTLSIAFSDGSKANTPTSNTIHISPDSLMKEQKGSENEDLVIDALTGQVLLASAMKRTMSRDCFKQAQCDVSEFSKPTQTVWRGLETAIARKEVITEQNLPGAADYFARHAEQSAASKEELQNALDTLKPSLDLASAALSWNLQFPFNKVELPKAYRKALDNAKEVLNVKTTKTQRYELCAEAVKVLKDTMDEPPEPEPQPPSPESEPSPEPPRQDDEPQPGKGTPDPKGEESESDKEPTSDKEEESDKADKPEKDKGEESDTEPKEKDEEDSKADDDEDEADEDDDAEDEDGESDESSEKPEGENKDKPEGDGEEIDSPATEENENDDAEGNEPDSVNPAPSEPEEEKPEGPAPEVTDDTLFGEPVDNDSVESDALPGPVDVDDADEIGNDKVVAPDKLCSKKGLKRVIYEESDATEYNKAVLRMRPQISAVQASLKFRNNDVSMWNRGCSSGDLDEGSLDKLVLKERNPAIWERRELIGQPKVAVGLLLDQSGSMDGIKILQARDVCITMAAALGTIKGVALMVLGHDGDMEEDIRISGYGVPEPPTLKRKEVVHFGSTYHCRFGSEPRWQVWIHEFFTKQHKNPYAIVHAKTGGNNYDSFAMEFAAEKMMVDYPDHPRRLLFVISDGQPAGTDYGETEAMKHMRLICENSRRHNLSIYGIGIANAYGPSFGIGAYGKGNFVVLDDVTSSITILTAFLRQVATKQ